MRSDWLHLGTDVELEGEFSSSSPARELLPRELGFNIGSIVGGVISVASGIFDGGGGEERIECEDALLGKHWPGPFTVQEVFAAYQAAPESVKQRALELARLNPRCREKGTARMSTADGLSICRVLVWQAHGAENGDCGSNCQPTREFLQNTLRVYGVADPQATPYQPTTQEQSIAERIAAEARRIAGTISNTADDVGAGIDGARAGVGANQATRDIFGGGGGLGTGIAIAGVGALLFFALRRE